MSAARKFTTRLTGMAECKNPKYVLTIVYNKILRALTKLPDSSAYKKYTQEIIASRAAIVLHASDRCEIEEKINCGIVEELIIQAENELRLIRNFTYSKPWESLISEQPEDQWKWPPCKIS